MVEKTDAEVMSRAEIYYWKCDRPAAFHGTGSRGDAAAMEPPLKEELARHFGGVAVALRAGEGQGNHRTWRAEIGGRRAFLRVEDGPEGDSHLAVESRVLDRIREAGVRTPRVLGYDASRTRVPFAWQALELLEDPDLNQWFKRGELKVQPIAFAIGSALARWQSIRLEGFGTLDGNLRGSRQTYADYFHLRLDSHLLFLNQQQFLDAKTVQVVWDLVNTHAGLLELAEGCLVHKDLALWNILGQADEITAFIDFDDAISGDAMDDLSLLACFHDAAFLRWAFEGYESVRPLPEQALPRLWLHLLRNMIVKAVIRLGAGYFERDDGFFLMGRGVSGRALRVMTQERLSLALRALREGGGLDMLE